MLIRWTMIFSMLGLLLVNFGVQAGVETKAKFPPNDLEQDLDRALHQASVIEKGQKETNSSTEAGEILKNDMGFPRELPEKQEISSGPDSILPQVRGDKGAREEKIETTLTSKKQEDKLTEAEIPVLASTTKVEDKSMERSPWRVILSLAVVIILAVSISFAAKYWTRNRFGVQDQNKIRILTQHHLGPKKSLAIVQVAGESLLLAITEKNINLIKPLALIDDEVPDATPSHFLGELDSFEEKATAEVLDKVNLLSPASDLNP
ncbi:MAG: flagellar biosynthetic protein FliO, partial [Bdellovibrionales bacterium]|nr:flagellar biosynthetic protein FliO [Bdellovibrionales bacterium]